MELSGQFTFQLFYSMGEAPPLTTVQKAGWASSLGPDASVQKRSPVVQPTAGLSTDIIITDIRGNCQLTLCTLAVTLPAICFYFYILHLVLRTKTKHFPKDR